MTSSTRMTVNAFIAVVFAAATALACSSDTDPVKKIVAAGGASSKDAGNPDDASSAQDSGESSRDASTADTGDP